MLKQFIYTVKLVVQHKMLGTLDFIVKDFNASIEINEKEYFVPFALNSESILNEMNNEIETFLTLKKYIREDIDFISYEVSTDDPYIDVFFSAEDRPEVHNILPQIEASVIPETFQPPTPYNFYGMLVGTDAIEWSWSGVEDCAYKIYDQNDKVIAQVGIDTLLYMEVGIEKGKNYTRKVSAFNVNGESQPTNFVTIEVTDDLVDESTPVKESTLLETVVKEVEPVEDNVELLEAFKSGVGDNLDLLVNQPEELNAYEKFDFNIILEGYRREKQRHFTAIPFTYKVIATGKKYIDGAVNTEYITRITPWPICNVNYALNSYIYEPFTYTIKYILNVKYDALIIPPTPLVVRPVAIGLDAEDSLALERPTAIGIETWSETDAAYGEIVPGVYEDATEQGVINLTDITPQYIPKYKQVIYTQTFTINKPETNKFMTDLLEYVKTNDSEIALARKGSVSIESTQLVECDKNVTLTITENKLYSTCTANRNFYEYKRSENLNLSIENGKVRTLVKPEEVILVNVYGNQYYGVKLPTTKITYNFISPFITMKDSLGNIQPVVITGRYPTLIATMSEVTGDYIFSASLNDEAPTKRELLNDMFTDLTQEKYVLQVEELSSSGEYQFYTSSTNSVVSVNGSKYISIDNTPEAYLEFKGIPGKALIDWSEESKILSGVINGNEPMRNNDDGKKDFVSIAPYFDVNDEVIDLLFTIQLVDTGDKFIYIRCRNQIDYAKTTVNGDVLVFSSDDYEMVDTYGKWTGAVIKTEEWEINTADPIRFYSNIYNPLYDYSVLNMDISDVRVKAQSLNPNVVVNPVNQDIINFASDEYKDTFKIPFLFEAKILSPSQNAWSPTITPGHYYINNDEFFIHAKSKPYGINSVIPIPDEKPFYASIKASIETKADESAFTKTLNSKSHFSAGEKELVVINDSGSISLAQIGMNGPFPAYAESGSYITEPLSFYQAIMLLKTDVVSSYKENIKLYVSGEIAGIWTPWQSANPGIVYNFGDNVDRFKIKIELKRLSIEEAYTENAIDKRRVDWLKAGYEIVNTIVEDSVITLQNKSEPGLYVSPILGIDTDTIKTLKLELNTNQEADAPKDYNIYVATSATAEGIESSVADWHDITNTMEEPITANKFIRYKIELFANSKTVINSVTKVFDGEAVKDCTPVVTSVTVSSDVPEWMFVGYVTKSILCKVPTDGETHNVTENTILDTIYPDILASGITNPRIQNLEIFIVDETVNIFYDNEGTTPLQAKSLNEEHTYIESGYIDLDENHEGVLSPIPQLGRPVVALHEEIGTLKHVTFFDKDDNFTLTNTETFKYDGRNAVSLGYTDIDVDSLKIFLPDKTEVPVKKVINNNVYFKDIFTTSLGNEITVTYKVINSFVVDYNYNLDANRAKIIVHLSENTSEEEYKNIQLFYETEDYDDYYATELELNPLYNDISTGFIYLTHEENTPKYITINMNPDVFDANGTDTSYMFIKLTDEIGNPVSNTPIQITSAHGKILLTNNVTNKFGVVTAKYFSPDYECEDVVAAMITGTSVSSQKKISIKKAKARTFVTAISSDNVYIISEGEEVTIEAKVFSENLVPYLAQDMTLFIANYYGASITMKGITNNDGKCYFTVIPVINSADNISRIEISCLGVKEYIDIKVVK